MRAAMASPFDYANATTVLIVKDVPRDDTDQVAAAYRELFLASGGGALGLFTAIGRLRAVHQRIAPALEEANLPLYAQHVGGMDAATLVDIFRAEEHSCLLGTDAVRDGVDVPGRSLRLIVFDRVPWPRPDILHRARKAAWKAAGAGANAYDDMLARLRLKQAYGRLIRRADDRGVFVMLDSRLPSRLLGAFPAGVSVEADWASRKRSRRTGFLQGQLPPSVIGRTATTQPGSSPPAAGHEQDDQEDHRDDERDEEQHARDRPRAGSDVGEAEDAGDDGDQEEDQRPLQHVVGLRFAFVATSTLSGRPACGPAPALPDSPSRCRAPPARARRSGRPAAWCGRPPGSCLSACGATSGTVGMASRVFGAGVMTDLSSTGGGLITPPERARSCVVTSDFCPAPRSAACWACRAGPPGHGPGRGTCRPRRPARSGQ